MMADERQTKKMNESSLYKVGDEVEVLIKKFTPQEHRIALSVKDMKKD